MSKRRRYRPSNFLNPRSDAAASMQDSKASVRSGWKRWLPTSAEKDSPACGLPPDADSPPEYWQAILSDARADAAGQSISRRQTPPGSTVRTRSGKMSVSGCSTTPARSEPGVLRKTAAGRPSTYLRRQSMAPEVRPDAPLRRGPQGSHEGVPEGAGDGQHPFRAACGDAGQGRAMLQQADRLLGESWNENVLQAADVCLPWSNCASLEAGTAGLKRNPCI
jgi:hypothetical protein